jgi:predicted nucleic acid-binding protein
VLIGHIDLLRLLYARILVPPAVLAELKHPAAPRPVQDWAVNVPDWVEVLSPTSSLVLGQLDLGESEAIALAAEVHADVVLMDEQAGRQEAVRRGLKVAGTLSVLDEAEQAGLVNFDAAIAELQKTSFRVSQAVLAILRRDGLADSLDNRRTPAPIGSCHESWQVLP